MHVLDSPEFVSCLVGPSPQFVDVVEDVYIIICNKAAVSLLLHSVCVGIIIWMGLLVGFVFPWPFVSVWCEKGSQARGCFVSVVIETPN